MKTVIYNQADRVAKWVGERVDEQYFAGAEAIGLEKDGKLIAGVVFNMYTGPSISMHVAAEPGTYWLTKDFLWRCFAYPFLQLRCNRVTGLTKADNIQAQKFIEHLGFKHEGIIRRGWADGTDVVLYGMLKDECRFLEMKR